MDLVKNLLEQYEDQIEEIHDYFKTTYEGLTLVECLMCGWRWNRYKVLEVKSKHFEDLKKFYLEWDYDAGKEAMVNNFPGLYDRIELQNARARLPAIQELLKGEHHLDPDISIEDLEYFSMRFGDVPTVAYAIKAFFLSQYDKESWGDFQGIMPMTGPARKTSNNVFKLDHNQYEHTLMCIAIAEKFGIGAVNINTLFYIMGKEL